MATSIAFQSAAVVAAIATTATTVTTSLIVPVVANLIVPIVPIAIPIVTSVVSTTCSVIKYGTVKVYSMVSTQDTKREEKDSLQATT